MQSTDTDDDFSRPVFVTERDNLADLISKMSARDLELYNSLGHIFTEAAFIDRKFVVVETKGKRGPDPKPPKVLGTLRVIAFNASSSGGSVMTLQDETGKTLQVGHVPTRLFGFPVFVSVPIYQGLKWEAKELRDGSYRRSLVWGVCFKQRSAIKWMNPGNVSVLTPNDFRKWFSRS